MRTEMQAMREMVTKSLRVQEALVSRVASLEEANAQLQASTKRNEQQAESDAQVVQDAKSLMEECVEMMEVRQAVPAQSTPPQVEKLEAMSADM